MRYNLDGYQLNWDKIRSDLEKAASKSKKRKKKKKVIKKEIKHRSRIDSIE